MQPVLDKSKQFDTRIVERRRYQVAVEDLRLRMFVVELDRPWLDTPFLLQGLLIESQIELDTLVKCCDYVHVDLERSSPAVADFIRRADMQTRDVDTDPAPADDDSYASTAAPAKASSSAAVSAASPATAASTRAATSPGTADSRRSSPSPQSAASAKSAASTLFAAAASGTSAEAANAGPFAAASESDLRADPAAYPDGTANDNRIVPRSATARGDSRPATPRADVRINQSTRKRFRHLVRKSAGAEDTDDGSFAQRWFGRLFNLSGRKRGLNLLSEQRAVDRDLVPAGVEPVLHDEQRPMLEELPRARVAFSRSEATLADVMEDLRNGRAPHLETIKEATDSLVESMLDNPDALLLIARLRNEDITTFNHGVKVALYLLALGRHLGFPREQLAHLGQIGMLADLGKTRLPRRLLEKPGMLRPDEFDLVKQHVDLTLQVLALGPTALPAEVTSGIAQHHERMDGSGYPQGLKGNQISIYGKMAAIADSFAALITPRAYANASAPQDALMSLYEWRGTSFHEPMVEQFVQAIGVFPVGSMIELSTGEIGVVVTHNRVHRLEPKVLILSKPDKSPLAQPQERDLFKAAKPLGGKPLRIIRGLPAGAFGFKLHDYYLDDVVRPNGILA